MTPAAPRKLLDEIAALKKKRRAVIMAHNYQLDNVQLVADMVGDSLELAREAAKTDAKVIVLCGVHFMAETAAILNPDKTVLLPDMRAGCGLADMITVKALRELKSKHPGAPVVCYVNTTADVKAESDICCTSSNAAKVVNSLPEKKVIFVPDRNLGRWVMGQTDKEIILWDGFCPVHQQITAQDVIAQKAAHAGAVFLAHPECDPEVLALSDRVLSTSGMMRFAHESRDKEFLIATEAGILHRLRRENPDKLFYAVTPAGVCCEGALCEHMKRNTLEKVRDCLRDMKPVVRVPSKIAAKARIAVERMLKAA